jgi:hypothetical protein
MLPGGTEKLWAEALVRPLHTAWLSRHVHVCKLNSTVIVLDVARDRYLGLTGLVERALADTVPGWPAPCLAQEAPMRLPLSRDETSKILRRLIDDGVLTDHESEGKTATPPGFDPSAARVALDHNIPRRHIRLSDIATFLAACISTAWSLRCRSLHYALEALLARRTRHGTDLAFDVELAADLVPIFRRLRSFTFSAHRRCLFHALTLMKFLSHYGLYPTFVMGVKIDPWAAHSWVQYGEYILDGTPEQVRFYKAILVI